MTVLFVPAETVDGETRCAAVPDSVSKFKAMGIKVEVEAGAGLKAAIADEAFVKAGATMVKSARQGYGRADIIIKVRPPHGAEIKLVPKGCVLVSLMEAHADRARNAAIAKTGADVFALELVPRISRAQSMDALSSQSNLAGYRAVIEAGYHFGRAFPMMMTAAGTVAPAKVLVMGAGVAGLQAIATAKRLGAVVSASDVRPAAKEQVESLGGRFVAVEDDEFRQAETAGGYAKNMSAAYMEKQQALIAQTISQMDIVITTALVPGRAAPKLVSAKMVKSMKTGAVILDMAAAQGGNCELCAPDRVVVVDGVTIVGHTNLPARLPGDASGLYARNLLNFVDLIWDREAGAVRIDTEDEIIRASLVARQGSAIHPDFGGGASKGGAPDGKVGKAGKTGRSAGARKAGKTGGSAGAKKVGKTGKSAAAKRAAKTAGA